MFKRVMLLLLLVIFTMGSMGCLTLGIKEKREIVFVSPVPIPEAAKGAPMIATNRKIKLAILNKPDAHFEQSIQGYVVVDPQFFGILIEAYKKSRERPE